jgi:hypothetical protein
MKKHMIMEAVEDLTAIYDELEPEIFKMYEEILGKDFAIDDMLIDDVIGYLEMEHGQDRNLYRRIMTNKDAREDLLSEIESIIYDYNSDMV